MKIENNELLHDPFHPENIELYKRLWAILKKEGWNHTVTNNDGDHSWEFVISGPDLDESIAHESTSYWGAIHATVEAVETYIGLRDSFEVTLLELDKPTANGRVYSTKQIADFLQSKPDTKGLGHYVTVDDYSTIGADLKKVCGAVHELTLHTAEDGTATLVGKLKPTGPLAHALLGDRENLNFGLRAIIRPQLDGSTDLVNILGWNLVAPSN